MTINLHVERIVLHGLSIDPAHHAALIQALERELTIQLTARPATHWSEHDVSLAAVPSVRVRLPHAPLPASAVPGMATGIASGITQALTAVRGGCS